MSIEFFGKPAPPLSDDLAACVLAKLRRLPGLVVLREEGSRSLYLDFMEVKPTQERMTIILENDRVYVAFHAATGWQEIAVVSAVEGALQSCGVSCLLVED